MQLGYDSFDGLELRLWDREPYVQSLDEFVSNTLRGTIGQIAVGSKDFLLRKHKGH